MLRQLRNMYMLKCDLREFTREELVKAIAEFVRCNDYNDRGEIADALVDGSWLEKFKYEN